MHILLYIFLLSTHFALLGSAKKDKKDDHAEPLPKPVKSNLRSGVQVEQSPSVPSLAATTTPNKIDAAPKAADSNSSSPTDISIPPTPNPTLKQTGVPKSESPSASNKSSPTTLNTSAPSYKMTESPSPSEPTRAPTSKAGSSKPTSSPTFKTILPTYAPSNKTIPAPTLKPTAKVQPTYSPTNKSADSASTTKPSALPTKTDSDASPSPGYVLISLSPSFTALCTHI